MLKMIKACKLPTEPHLQGMILTTDEAVGGTAAKTTQLGVETDTSFFQLRRKTLEKSTRREITRVGLFLKLDFISDTTH